MVYFRVKHLSDSSDFSSSDEEIHKHVYKKLKTRHFKDQTTSTFHTKNKSQEDLTYVDDNVFKTKKSKQNKFRQKSSHSNNQSQIKVNFYF